MQFEVRTVGGKYKEIIFRDGSTTVETGLLDDKDCRNLAEVLREAANDLMYGVDE